MNPLYIWTRSSDQQCPTMLSDSLNYRSNRAKGGLANVIKSAGFFQTFPLEIGTPWASKMAPKLNGRSYGRTATRS